MKITVIGDIHGRTNWREIIKREIDNTDKIIFLGDYLDPYPISRNPTIFPSFDEIMLEFNDIINLKKEFNDKIILLLGNHDTHYMYDVSPCTRYDFNHSKEIRNKFIENRNLFQYAYQIKNYLFTHAGVNKKFYEKIAKYIKNDNIADYLNKMSESVTGNLELNVVGRYRGGFMPYSGIVWADRVETMDSYIDGFHQFVGHSKVNNIETIGDVKSSITYCDVLEKNINIEKKYINIEI